MMIGMLLFLNMDHGGIESDCDHCDAYQWFLTNQGLYTNQAAFDGDWDSWGGDLICPQHDVNMCESCGERFVDDGENWR